MLLCRQRQADADTGPPLVQPGYLSLDAAAARLDEALGDGEAEPAATRHLFGCIDAMEAVEHTLQLCLRNATPLVGDLDQSHFGFAR